MKKHLKTIALGLVMAVSMTAMVGCSSGKTQEPQGALPEENAPKATLNIMAMSGPTGMGMAKLMDDAEQGNTAVDYKVSIVGAADEISGKMISGEIDMAAVPCNLASVLYNKTEGKVQVAAINTLGVLYILEKGDEIQSIADLKGKTIISTGKGTTPEYILNYLLKANGLDPEKDVTIEYKSEAAEIAAAFQNGSATVAMAPQPFVTSVLAKNADVRVALDVTEEWEKAQGEDAHQLVTGTVIVRKEVAEKNKEAVDQFLKDYQASIEYVNNNVEDAAALIEKYNIAAADIAKKAIPQCNIVYIDGEDMKNNIEQYLTILHEANPASVGGKLPDAEFYYNK